MGKRFVIAGVGTSNTDGDGVVHGGADDKSGFAAEIDVDSAGAEGGVCEGHES